jgi:predicted ATPase
VSTIEDKIIVGEPGLGKSRLIEEFHARLAHRPHTWVEWSCSQLLQNTPLHPGSRKTGWATPIPLDCSSCAQTSATIYGQREGCAAIPSRFFKGETP